MLDGHLDDLSLLHAALPLLHVGVGDQAAQVSCSNGQVVVLTKGTYLR
jgi:hypothetical protein